ncbi:hypothetical protein F5Y08DRAFT_322254 [Xylaria arbuscula]|nr:hypothetical protein F5Y08DRAFT_322254 [Xylaria arbuscula]
MACQVSSWERAKVEAFLAPRPENQEISYQIGIAFVGKHNTGSGGGHAEIVIRDGNGLYELGPPSHLDLSCTPVGVDLDDLIRAGPCKLIKTQNIQLRVLHLRNANDGSGSLQLALETKSRVQYYRYTDLYRIRTTERQFKHIALISCQDEYNILADDCATYCQTFLNRLLDHLLDKGQRNGGIGKDEYRRQKYLLEQQIHVEGGLVGEAEWRGPARIKMGY